MDLTQPQASPLEIGRLAAMRVVSIACGRTYNTGNYTSQRYEISAELHGDLDVDDAMFGLARYLDNVAQATMRRLRGEDVDEEIPF